MHVHTVRTKYTFGDRVRYASKLQGNGTGKIVNIIVEDDMEYCYFIEVDGGGDTVFFIRDADITPVTDDPDVSTPHRV